MTHDNKNIEKLDFETIEHEQLPYTIISTHVVQHITNYVAGFIWVYLQSLPSDWKVNKKHIMEHFDISERTYQRYMAYLSESNLVEYVRPRLKCGQFGTPVLRVLNGTKFKYPDDENHHTAKNGIVVTDHTAKNDGVVTIPPKMAVWRENEKPSVYAGSHHTAKKPHSGGLAPFTKEEEEVINNKKTSSSSFEDLDIDNQVVIDLMTDQRLLLVKRNSQANPEYTEREFLEACKAHLDAGNHVKYNLPQRLGGLCKIIAMGTFAPPAGFKTKRQIEEEVEKERVKKKLQEEAGERQHQQYLARLRGENKSNVSQEPRSKPTSAFTAAMQALKATEKAN